MKLEEKEGLAGAGIETAYELLFDGRGLLRRHHRRVDRVLPSRQLVRLVPLPELLVVVVDRGGRHGRFERDRGHLAKPAFAPRQALDAREEQWEQPAPHRQPGRPAMAVPPRPQEDLADELLGGQIVGTEIAERYAIAQLAPGGSEQLFEIGLNRSLEGHAIAAQRGCPLPAPHGMKTRA